MPILRQASPHVDYGTQEGDAKTNSNRLSSGDVSSNVPFAEASLEVGWQQNLSSIDCIAHLLVALLVTVAADNSSQLNSTALLATVRTACCYILQTASMSQFQQKQVLKALDNVPRAFQETNIHLFCEQGQLSEVERAISDGEVVDKRNTRRQTPLHCACSGGHPA
eukprot:21311-Heterococcus_DN1.PRE.1